MNCFRHKRLFLIAFPVLAILVCALYLAARPTRPAASPTSEPEISWTPSSVSESIPAGQTKTLSVSFRSSLILSNITVRVVPELQTFVKVEPQSFATVAAQQDTTLSLIISSPGLLLPTTIKGVIQLRDATAPDNTIAQPLPVTLNITWSKYQNDELGFSVSVPPSFIAHQSTDPAVKEVVFLKPPATSDSDVMILVNISPLPSGQTLEQAVEQGGIDTASISQVTLGGRVYLKFVSPGQGDGSLSYVTSYSQNQAISFSAPVGSFASSSAFTEVVESLAVLK